MNLFKSLLLTVVGVVLLWLALRNLPLQELGTQLKHANYWLIIPVFLVTLFVYYIRIKRWQLLYKSLHFNVPFKAAWISLCAGYLVSYVVPRGGEITRCLLVKRYKGVPFNQSLATVIIERVTDTVCLLLLLFGILIFNIQETASFFHTNIILPLSDRLNMKSMLLIGLLGFMMLGGVYFYISKKAKDDAWATSFVHALKRLLLLDQKGYYALYTLIIWIGYFLMTYFWIFAFKDSSLLTFSQVFVVMVIGSIGKSVPIQGGGMGAYHYLVAQAFFMFGVGLVTGNALAIIIHGAQTIYTLITGSTAYLMVIYDEKDRNLLS
jgi:uncharacterized membrane protein YbhN (UPF0104 family)